MSNVIEQKVPSQEKPEAKQEPSGHPPLTVSGVFLLVALFALIFGYFCFISLKRPADVDEGFFLVMGKSIFVNGRTIYLDFFSPQMPLLPYVYGFIMSLFGYTWKVARIFNSLFPAGIGLILCWYAVRSTRSKAFALSVALIFCFSPFIFIWFSCARVSALATFLLVASVCFLPPINTHSSALAYLYSGVLLGLSVDTRLYVLAAAPAIIFHLIQVEKQRWLRSVAFFVTGICAALSINLPLFLASPSKYVWNIIGIHALKTSSGLIGALPQKGDVLLKLLFDYPSFRPTLYFGYILIFFLYLVHQALRRKPLLQWNPAFLVAAAIFLVSILPTPTFSRYFVVAVPLFLLLGIDLFGSLLLALRRNMQRKALIAGVLAVSILFSWFGAGKVDYYLFKGNNLGGSMPTEGGKADWNMDNVRAVSQAIDRLVAPDAAVVSLWPGYLLESDVQILPKTENVTLLELEHSLPENINAISQTITDKEVRTGIRDKKIDLLIYGNSVAPQVGEYKRLLIENGYIVAKRIGGISLFLSPEYRSASIGKSHAALFRKN
jgi:hypothetical protein